MKYKTKGLFIIELLTVDLPQNLENLQLPAPELVNYWRMADNRIFYIDYEITTEILEIQKAIIAINIADKNIPINERTPIKIYISSPGGDLIDTLSLAKAMILSKTKVITVNLGMAYSAGGILLLAGHERYAMPYSTALLHSGSTNGIYGTFEQSEEFQKTYKKIVEDMWKYVSERTTIDDKTLKRNKSKDWYFDVEDQIKYGLVDKVVEDIDEII